jgi:hypothetical protein
MAHEEGTTQPADEGPVERPVRQRDPSAHVAWCRYVMKHERPTRIVLCDSDAEGAFPVFRYPHDDECTNDQYARSVCEGMWADKCDDVIALVEALRAVYALAGESREVKRIVHEAITKHGGPEVA